MCLRRFVTKLGMEHLLQTGGGKRREVVVIDIDGLPIDAHGRQHGSTFHGRCKRTIFMSLIASFAEPGDMLGAELRPGTQSVVRDCYGLIRRVALQVRRHVADRVVLRLDAGFSSGELCDKLECGGGVMCLRDNAVLNRLADPRLACSRRVGAWRTIP